MTVWALFTTEGVSLHIIVYDLLCVVVISIFKSVCVNVAICGVLYQPMWLPSAAVELG